MIPDVCRQQKQLAWQRVRDPECLDCMENLAVGLVHQHRQREGHGQGELSSGLCPGGAITWRRILF